eukprot:gene2966-1948_t
MPTTIKYTTLTQQSFNQPQLQSHIVFSELTSKVGHNITLGSTKRSYMDNNPRKAQTKIHNTLKSESSLNRNQQIINPSN